MRKLIVAIVIFFASFDLAPLPAPAQDAFSLVKKNGVPSIHVNLPWDNLIPPTPSGFDFKVFGGTADNITDNCSALASLVSSVNSYSGPGLPYVFFSMGSSDTAFFFSNCSANFTRPVTIVGGAGIGGGAVLRLGASFTGNFLDFGLKGQTDYSANPPQTQPYTASGLIFMGGGAGAKAIYCEPYIVQCMATFNQFNDWGGAGSYIFYAPGPNNSVYVLGNKMEGDDSTAGRNAIYAVDTSSFKGGSDTSLIAFNSLIPTNQPHGGLFDIPCGGTGISTFGQGTQVIGNLLYSFNTQIAIPVQHVSGQQYSIIVADNDIAAIGCDTAVAAIVVGTNGVSDNLFNLIVHDNTYENVLLGKATGWTGTYVNASIHDNKIAGVSGPSCGNVTGAGTTCSIAGGSDEVLSVEIDCSTSCASSGHVDITWGNGFQGGVPHCSYGNISFASSATFFFSSFSATKLTLNWNNGTALTNGSTNFVDLICRPRVP